jgi:hypothetical protein
MLGSYGESVRDAERTASPIVLRELARRDLVIPVTRWIIPPALADLAFLPDSTSLTL